MTPLSQRLTRLRWALAAAGSAYCALATEAARAAPLAILERDRGVYARASAGAVGDYQETIAADEAPGSAHFAANVQALAETATSRATATAAHASQLGAEALQAYGSVRVTGSAESGDAEAPADSFFEVAFEAGGDDEFVLLGAVRALVTGGPGDGHASVMLVDDATGLPLVSERAAPGQQGSFHESGSLVAGARYRLRGVALARTDWGALPPYTTGVAAFQLVIAVPEPGEPLLFASGIGGLALLAALRAGSGRARELRP